jgi:hypothetical protein
MKTMFCSLALLIIFTSCSQKFSLQKRRYGKGFYFASARNHTAPDQRRENNFLRKTIAEPSETETAPLLASAGKNENQILSLTENKYVSKKNTALQKKESSKAASQTIRLHRISPASNLYKTRAKSHRSSFSDNIGVKILMGIGSLLSAILLVIYLLTMMTLTQAIITALIILALSALLGGGVYNMLII